MFVKKINDSICIKTKKEIQEGYILFINIVNNEYVCNGIDYHKNNKIENLLYFDDTFRKKIVTIINEYFNTSCLLHMFLKNINYYETGIGKLIEDYCELENFKCKLKYSKYDLEKIFQINYKEIELNKQLFYNLFENVESIKYIKENNRHIFSPIILNNINNIVEKVNKFLQNNNTYIHTNETREFGNLFNIKNNFYTDIDIENVNHNILAIDIYKTVKGSLIYRNNNSTLIKITTFIYNNKKKDLDNTI